ncbi:hypothetical protein D3C79_1019320 [compost metagenome]
MIFIDARTESHNFASKFQTGNVRSTRRGRILTTALHHIGAIDAGCRNFDEKLPMAWLWD